MSDRRLEPRSAGKQPREFVFTGHHERLVTGATYTLGQVSIIIGVNNKTMHSRMRGKTELTNKEVQPTNDIYGLSNRAGRSDLHNRLEDVSMKKSDAWLRRKL